jgi:hypothetical protein
MKLFIFVILFFSFQFTCFSKNLDNYKLLLIEKTNKEKISILSYKYIDSLDFANKKTFNLYDIFSKTNKVKNYELEISVPFKLIQAVIPNLGIFFAGNYSNLNNFFSVFNNPDMGVIPTEDIIDAQLNLLSTNKFNVILPRSFPLINIKLPFYLFENLSNTTSYLYLYPAVSTSQKFN